MEKIGKCKVCGCEFVKKGGNHLICSEECKKKQWRDKYNAEKERTIVKKPADKTSIYDMVEIAMKLSKERGKIVNYGDLQAEIITGKIRVRGGAIV